MSRGGRGGARGGGQRSAPGTVMIAGTEMAWDLSGIELQKGPGELFPVSSIACPALGIALLPLTPANAFA